MAVLTLLPQINLKWDDVRDTLNANGGTVTNNVASAFSSAANINMWAKYKPVINSETEYPFSSDWWKALSGNCGIAYKQITSYTSLPDNTDGDMNGWEYQLPHSNVPKRLGDFRNYFPAALPPISDFATQAEVAKGNGLTGQVAYNIGAENTLTLEDIGLGDMYFGIYLCKQGESSGFRVTNTAMLKNSGYDATLDTTSIAVGEYEVYPFLASAAQVQANSDVASNYYTLPNIQKRIINIVTQSSLVSITITATYYSSGMVIYSVSVTSNGGGTSFENSYVALRYASKKIGDAYVTGEVKKDLGTVTVVNGQTTTIASGKFTCASDMTAENIKIWCAIGNAQYTASIYPAYAVMS